MSARRKKKSPQKLLGEAIRARRLELELSQEKLAEHVGVHRNYVGNVERGVQNPTVESLVRFADALGCTCSELMWDAGL